MENRYIVTMDFYVHADSDKQAIEAANTLADLIGDYTYDDVEPAVLSIEQKNYGQLTSRKLEKIK